MIPDVDFTYRHQSNNIFTHSVIDHFASSKRFFHVIEEAGVIHSAENTCNHSAIYAKVAIEKLDLTLENYTPDPRVS